MGNSDTQNIVRAQWLPPETAHIFIRSFEKRFGKKHLVLACHAALPMVLTPELVNLIRINFTGTVDIPWIAEADLLLSPLCRKIGRGVYEMEPGIREILVKRLENLYGRQRCLNLARFLISWLRCRPNESLGRYISESHRWVAMAYVNPAGLVNEMEDRIKGRGDQRKVLRTEQMRLAGLAEIVTPVMKETTEWKRFEEQLEHIRQMIRPVAAVKSATGEGDESPAPGEILEVHISGLSEPMEFVFIPPGTFMMGSPEGEPGRYDDEVLHEVELTRGFYMQTTPVTQGQWKAVMGNNPSQFKACGDDCPVERVSWHDAKEFIERLNSAEGKPVYRLPAEAEWEYACRAGTTTPFNTGNCLSSDTEANYDGNYPLEGCTKGQYREKTTPVKTFPPNAWGLYDMHGNVWEWCEDWYGKYPRGKEIDPTGPEKGSGRVLRGGGWYGSARGCRSACRDDWIVPTVRYDNVGFRLVRSLPF